LALLDFLSKKKKKWVELPMGGKRKNKKAEAEEE
jgi:hypothetical protein